VKGDSWLALLRVARIFACLAFTEKLQSAAKIVLKCFGVKSLTGPTSN
jgi:hypothetical protein